MADIALLKCNLAIEPDLQNFVGFVLTTVHNLGGNTFAATPAALELARRLRKRVRGVVTRSTRLRRKARTII